MEALTKKRGLKPPTITTKTRNLTIVGYIVPQGELPPNPRHPDPYIPVEQRHDRFLKELAGALAEIVPAKEEDDGKYYRPGRA